jgi:hypothetical protein
MPGPCYDSRVLRLRPSHLPLLLTLIAIGWFAVRPGFPTLFMALFAFFAWAGTRFAEFLFGQAAAWRRRIETALGIARDEYPRVSPAELPDNPVFRSLLADLKQAERLPEFGDQARRAMHQLARLPELFSRFEATLEEKLNPGELTHERYRSAGRRVFESTLGELQGAARRMTEIGVIERGSPGSAFALRRFRHEQLVLLESQLDRSEAALAEMARIGLAVSSMRGKGSGETGPEFEAAIRDLRELAERTKRY